MRLHPREQLVTNARITLVDTILAWRKDHQDLTDGELLSVLGDVLGSQITSVAKYMIRYERHGDTDQPGGIDQEPRSDK